jgi:DNA polymerase-3 subunit epsilon
MGLLSWLRKRRRRTVVPAPSPLGPPVLLPDEPVITPNGFVVIDVETTGLLPAWDRIIEIAAVRTDPSGRVIDEWTTLINPGCPVGATKIHGITAADVLSAPRFADVLGDLNARLAGRALVAHNALFDLAFIQTEYVRAGWALPAAPYLCTLDASWTYLPHLSRRRLSDYCWACGIQLHDAHSALGDARATASLLASYLAPKFGRPPNHEHVATPALAAQVAWPAVPRYAFDVTLRQAGAYVPMPAAPRTLWALLDNLPVTAVVDEGAPATATGYLELLFEVLEDGVLTDPEAQSLAEVAKIYALTRPQVEAAHRGFMLALAHKAVEDGKVTRNERNELFATAIALGFTDGIIRALLDEARAAMVENRGKDCKPLPVGWAYGEPLRIGEGVAFAGCDQLTRDRLEGRAQAAGLRVTGSVSRKTAVLQVKYSNRTIMHAILHIGHKTPAHALCEQFWRGTRP